MVEQQNGVAVVHIFMPLPPGCYQGLDRLGPAWGDDENVNALVDELAGWYESAPTVEQGLDLARRFRRLGVAVQVVVDVPLTVVPPRGAHLLGFDVTVWAYHSQLEDRDFAALSAATRPPLAPLWNLMGAYFGPHRNRRGLLPTRELAERLCACLKAVKALDAEAFNDYGSFAPEVHELYEVDIGVSPSAAADASC